MDEDTRCKRRFVVKEILDNEEFYVEKMEVIVALYKKPLEESRLLKSKDIDLIFGLFPKLLEFSQQLWNKLEKETKKYSDLADVQLAHVFESALPHFAIFNDFVANSVESGQTVAKLLSKNSRFRAFCKHAADKMRSRDLDLEDLLQLPIQRVPRYNLILERLLKHTPEWMPDSGILSRVLIRFSKAAGMLDKSARDSSEYSELAKLSKRLDNGKKGGILKVGRRIVKQGKLKKDKKDTTFFLFNDGFCYCRKGENGSKYKLCKFILFDEKTAVTDIPDTAGHRHEFQIVYKAKDFFVAAPDQIQKEQWMEAFQTAINSFRTSIGESGVKTEAFAGSSDFWNEDDNSDAEETSPGRLGEEDESKVDEDETTSESFAGFQNFQIQADCYPDPGTGIIGGFSGDLFTVFSDNGQGYVYGKNGRSGEMGWLPQSYLGSFLGIDSPSDSSFYVQDSSSSIYSSSPMTESSIWIASGISSSTTDSYGWTPVYFPVEDSQGVFMVSGRQGYGDILVFTANSEFLGGGDYLGFAFGDEIQVLQQGSSGYWLCQNLRTGMQGWISPRTLA